MANKVKRAIEDSKRKREFKHRNKGRVDRTHKKKQQEGDQYVQRKRQKVEESPEEDEEVVMQKMINQEDPELEQDLAFEAGDYGEELDDKEFQKEGDELDLPDLESEDEEISNDLQGEETDTDLEEYYKELGIQDEEDLSKPQKTEEEAVYKKEAKQKKAQEKKQKEDAKPEVVGKKKVLDKIIENTRTSPTYANLTRVIKIVKQVFNSEQQQDKEYESADDADPKKKKKAKQPKSKKQSQISAALNSKEYEKILDSFTVEVPALIIKVASIGTKAFNQNDIDLKKAYGHLSSKQQLLLKTYAANYTKLLQQTVDEGSSKSYLTGLLTSGSDVVKCILPFGIYTKKMAASCAKVSAQYSQSGEDAQLLAFAALRKLVIWTKSNKEISLFEFAVKKLYNEFTKESKVGGGGFAVQDGLRIAQNCFVELLGIDLSASYSLGFLYIRQLCLHLRNIRNNLTKDAIKNIYSWQFYNCMKLWVLALTVHQKELILLVHPIVQLAIGVIRISNNIKYFPFHVKVFQLMSLINEKTDQYIPIAQYILYPFDTTNDYLNAKSKPLVDKQIPETAVALKTAKKHSDTIEMKDRIVKETLDELTIYLSHNSRSLSFPELVIPIGVLLRKFKKQTHSSGYRKIVASFLDLVKKNEDYIVQKRNQMREKSLRNIMNMMQSFQNEIANESTPLEKERQKIENRRAELIKFKLDGMKDK